MPSERWDDRHDRLNKRDQYEKGDVDYNGVLQPELFGWVPTPPAQKELQFRSYNIDSLGLIVPYTVDTSLPWPTTVDGMNIIDAYEQNGGKCGAFSSMQAVTGMHMIRDGQAKRFNANTFYCKVRAKMGDQSCNANGGVTMPATGSVLVNWGAAQVINGKTLENDPNNGPASYVWGYNVDSIRSAVESRKIYPLIGITIYQAFLSPKKIGDTWWACWQEGSWGSALGGHMMVILDCYDSKKIATGSKGSFLLPNTWGRDFPACRMSYEAFTRLLGAAQPAEIMLCTDRVVGPAGKLELAEPFSIAPWPLRVGDRVTAHLKVTNTGEGSLTGISLAIEDMVDGTGGPGFGFTPNFDLAPSEVYDHNPVREYPVGAGHWRFRGDYKQNGRYTVLGVVEADVTDEPPPPPPPPPPVDHLTVDIAIHTADADYKLDGVEVPKVV